MNFLYDFAVEFIAAFFGFLFAMFLSGMSQRYYEKKKTKSVLNGIRNELEDIYDSVKPYTEKRVLLKHRIAIPTWDALQYSGGIMDLIGEDYYDDIIWVYSSIKRYNEEREELSEIEAYKELNNILSLSQKVLEQLPKEKENVKNSKSK